jgi:hypothetical protein
LQSGAFVQCRFVDGNTVHVRTHADAAAAARPHSYVAADVAHQTARAHEAGAPQDEARAAAALTQPSRAHMCVERQRASRPVSPSLPSRAQITRVAAQTATFQLLASIAAPFVVIHTAVGAAKKALASTKAARLGPTLVGLALIPALPIVDHPIEHGAARARAHAAEACCVAFAAHVHSGFC